MTYSPRRSVARVKSKLICSVNIGTWLRDIEAMSAPTQHQLYGTDINPAEFPSTDISSPSGTITYQTQDVNKPWPSDWTGKFDLVHQRLVLVAGGPRQKEVTLSLCNLVKPGGWIQLIEATNELPEEGCGPDMHTFVELINGIFVHMGADLGLTQHIPEWLEKDAGFVDVEFRDFDTRLGATNPEAELARRGVVSTSIAAKSLAAFGKSESSASPPL